MVTFVQNPVTLELVEKDKYVSQRTNSRSPYVIGDIDPYQSQATGEMITGRRQHREHLIRHDLIEIGNEKMEPKKRAHDPTIRQDILEAFNKHSTK